MCGAVVSAATSTALATTLCLECNVEFETPLHPNMVHSRVCSELCRAQRRRKHARIRNMDRIRIRSPQDILTERVRNRAWAAIHRKVTKRSAWLAGAPPFSSYLPGVSMPITITPAPRWPIELRNTRGLHGAITALLGLGHMKRFPLWSLFPYQSGWAIHWWPEANGERFANRRIDGDLYGRPTTFGFGMAHRLKTPSVRERGRRLVQADAITTVAIKSGTERNQERPTGDGIQRALSGEWLSRLGLDYLRTDDLIRVEMVSAETVVSRIELGVKYGTVSGWEGSTTLEVNAPARWLLHAAARLGFGSKVAFGFGCIRVTDLPKSPLC